MVINNIESTAKFLIVMGLIIVISGGILLLFHKMGLNTFRLPGDIIIRKENFTFYFPIVTSIVLSILLSIIFNIIERK